MYSPKKVSPIIEEHSFQKQCYSVEIHDEEYRVCQEASSNRWSNSKKGAYGSGILNSPKDPHKTERIGLLGEMAFGKLFDLPVDTEYKFKGDDRDFLINSLSVDVKTSSKLPDYQTGLIYAQSESGKKIPLKCDIYVFAFLDKEDIDKEYAKVTFIGFSEKSTIEEKELVKARFNRSKHKNKEIPYKELIPLKELFKITGLT